MTHDILHMIYYTRYTIHDILHMILHIIYYI